LAFIMVALSVLVISLVTMKFETQLKALQMKMSGVHKADIGRMGVAGAAFTLGISNMRKRRARTVFTCVTLILLTFTVLSFTSVKTATRYNHRKAKGKPTYQGLLIRNAMWEPLEESAYRVLKDEFGRERAVAPRAWFFTSKTEEQSFIQVSTSASDATYDARAVTGLSPAEAQVTGLDRALIAGRWFRPDDVHAAIIPTRMAETFHVGADDVGKVKIFLGGVPYDLIGIISGSRAKGIPDLDQEPLTPVDWIQMQRMARQGGGQQTQQGQKSGFQEYLHLSPDQVIFVPFGTAVNLGAEVESVAISFAAPGAPMKTPAQVQAAAAEVRKAAEEVTTTLTDLMPRLGFNLYAGTGDEIRKWSAIGRTSIIGMGDLLIPILIAALIVLNTMLGAVYEHLQLHRPGARPHRHFVHGGVLRLCHRRRHLRLSDRPGDGEDDRGIPLAARAGAELFLRVRGGLHHGGDRGGAAVHHLPGAEGLRSGDAGDRAAVARARSGGRPVGHSTALRGDWRAGHRAGGVHGGVVPGL
jgi:hypothetical protein